MTAQPARMRDIEYYFGRWSAVLRMKNIAKKRIRQHKLVALPSGAIIENRCWKRDWYDWIILFIYFATLVFVGFQAMLMRSTLVANQRAWLAPYNVQVLGDFDSGGESSFEVSYRNVGKEPANQVKQATAIAWPAKEQTIESVDLCPLARQQEGIGTTAYPSDSTYYTVGTLVRSGGSAFEILNGEKTFYLNGCLAYEIFGEVHHSKFCFYWVYEPGKALKEWKWRYCQTGNSAN